MSKRKGLLLDRQGSVGAALHDLGLPEWEFQSFTALDAAHRALSGKAPLVGIVVFDNVHSWPMRELEALIARHDIEWIAVVDRALMHDLRLAPLIARNFHDYHTLPADRERLRITLGHAHGKALITRAAAAYAKECGRFDMTGNSPPMMELYRQLEKVVSVDAPVLIGGESGTGKELVARAIHSRSARAGGPFMAMNCGAIPPNLIQSELFGHERGAFSGAHQRKVGSIEAADNGVLFLDEIGDLPLDLQANFLRFLQERTIVRVGSTERIRVDVRVIAATHVDLQRAVGDGQFREDLFYRLDVVHLRVPALRERSSDIPLLADWFFKQNSHQKAPQVRGFSTEALRAMQDYAWPGNVRELINRVQQAMIMSENRLITAGDLGLPDGDDTPRQPTLDEARASVEKEVIVSSLRRYGNNVSEVARQLGISRVTLYRMIERLNIVL